MDPSEAAGLEDQDVVTKYKMAAEMANKVVKLVADACVAGKTSRELCILGDEAIVKETGTVFNKKVDGKPVEKGVAFPTCISINACVCHNCPLNSDQVETLADGDVVKIDLGLHLDGYIAVVAQTVVVGAEPGKPIEGRKADVILAAYTAAQAAARLIKPGNKSTQVAKAVSQIADDFHCKPIEDFATCQIARFDLSGEKRVIQNPSERMKSEIKVEEFKENEVYAVDVIMSTGDGKRKMGDVRTSVYRSTGETYMLKGKHSRAFFAETTKRFGPMAFTLRNFENESQARMGVKECVEHDLMEPYEVLYAKEQAGEETYVAQFRMLLLLLPNGNVKVTGLDLQPEQFKSEYSVTDDELKQVLLTSLSAKKNKKKKNKKKAATAEASESK